MQYEQTTPKDNGKKTPELIERVLELLATGSTLSKACEAVGISTVAWHWWVKHDAALRDVYAQARLDGHDAMADQMIDIATKARASSDHVALARLQIDVRKTLLGKWDPRRYGDSSTLNLGNKDDKPFEIQPTVDGVALTKTIAKALRQGLLPAPSTDSGDDLL